MKRSPKILLQMILAFSSLFTLLAATPTMAGTVGGVTGTATAMPWDTALAAIMGNITGPWAGAIALMAIVVAGIMLIFGRDFGALVQSLIYIVIAIGIIVGASSIVTTLFTDAGTAALISVNSSEDANEHTASNMQPVTP